MDIDSKVFLGKKFKGYYLRNTVDAPACIEQREFGFGTLDDKIKFRHKSFRNPREMQDYLRRETPFYVSYSTAYYGFPGNRSMEDKQWLGADLVFDLDADMPFMDSKVLDGVKKQAVNLIGFLTDDFGLAREKIKVNYSGSKGYHIHCTDESVLKLGGEERREIVDYVTATGLERKYFLHEEEVQSGIVFGRSDRSAPRERSTILTGPRGESQGWARRMYEGVMQELEGSNIDVVKKKKLEELLERGVWEGVEGKREGFFDGILGRYAVKLTGDTDKMVTIDTTRLIRLPDSLHGGTGLKAAKVVDIGKFNPQADAVAFGDGEVKIITTRRFEPFKLKDNTYGAYEAGERITVPEHAAVYLMLKDGAELAG